MRKIFTLCFLFATLNVSATGWDKRNKELSKFRNSIQLSGGYFYDSNSITNEFALEYFRNGFIDEDMKDNVSGRLSGENRFGGSAKTELRYTRYTDSLFSMKNCFYSVALSNYYDVFSGFSDDAFELYFRGNKEYAGKKAELSNFEYQNLTYQQINFSFGHRYKREANSFAYTAGLS